MRIALRSTLIVAIASAAGAAHALQSPDWDVLEETAQHSLEYARTDEPAPWVNPDTGVEGTFTPVATHEGPEGQVCREYAVDAIIDGREEVVYGTACRLPDGTWVEANAEYTESEPPKEDCEVHSGTDWRWIIPNFTIAGGYCSRSFCVGGSFGSFYPSWYYPWRIRFAYWDYGYWGHHYRYYPYYTYYPRHHSYHSHTHYRHHRRAYHDRHFSHHRHKHRSHHYSEHKDRHRGGHSKRVDKRSRRSDHDRPTRERSIHRPSQGERYASHRTDRRQERGERRASERSDDRRVDALRYASHRSDRRHERGERRASERSRDRRSHGERYASHRSGGDRSHGRHASTGRSGRGGKGGKRSASRN